MPVNAAETQHSPPPPRGGGIALLHPRTNTRLCQRYATRLLHVADARADGKKKKKLRRRRRHRSKELKRATLSVKKKPNVMYIHALKIILCHLHKKTWFISRALVVFKKNYEKKGHVCHNRQLGSRV